MKFIKYFYCACACLLSLFVTADTLELKNGSILEGTFMGRSAEGISFQVGSETMVYSSADVVNLSFGEIATPEPPKPAQLPEPPPVAAPQLITVNAGTGLLVRMGSTISTSSSKQGEFFTSTLESDLIQNGVTIAPKGATVYGKISLLQTAGRLAGQNRLELQLTDILINNVRVPVMTVGVGSAGAREGANTIKTVGVAAGIGALAKSDSNKGAKRGAAVGGVLAAGRGQPIVIQRGTLMEFTLSQPLSVTVTR